MSLSTADQAATILTEARRGGHRLADLPEELRPANVAEAHAIQDATLRHLGAIGAWKVSPIRPDAEPGCAPIAASLITSSPATYTAAQLPEAEAEVEIAVKLGRNLPPRAAPYTADDLREAIATVHPAIEVLSSRFINRKAVAALTAVADGQSNAAIVLGAARKDWAGLDFGKVAMRLRLDGKEVTATEGGTPTDTVLASLAWLANHAGKRHGGLKQGDVVITGARLGPWRIGTATATADVDGLGEVSITITD